MAPPRRIPSCAWTSEQTMEPSFPVAPVSYLSPQEKSWSTSVFWQPPGVTSERGSRNIPDGHFNMRTAVLTGPGVAVDEQVGEQWQELEWMSRPADHSPAMAWWVMSDTIFGTTLEATEMTPFAPHRHHRERKGIVSRYDIEALGDICQYLHDLWQVPRTLP